VKALVIKSHPEGLPMFLQLIPLLEKGDVLAMFVAEEFKIIFHEQYVEKNSFAIIKVRI